MTKEILTNEILNDAELENISGGTVAQFEEIYSALEKQAGVAGDISNGLRKILSLIPGGDIGTAVWRNAAAPIAEKALKDCYGIDAYISIGWLGTGFRESGNRYSKDGKSLSHAEVLNIIAA